MLDLPGSGLLVTGLTLLLVGLTLGGGIYSWTSATTLSTIIVGAFFCIAFGIYEWKVTKQGIIHHKIFVLGSRYTRTFVASCILFAVEAALIFAFSVFYPILYVTLPC